MAKKTCSSFAVVHRRSADKTETGERDNLANTRFAIEVSCHLSVVSCVSFSAYCFLLSAFCRFAQLDEKPFACITIVHQRRDRRNDTQSFGLDRANQRVVVLARVTDNLR